MCEQTKWKRWWRKFLTDPPKTTQILWRGCLWCATRVSVLLVTSVKLYLDIPRRSSTMAWFLGANEDCRMVLVVCPWELQHTKIDSAHSRSQSSASDILGNDYFELPNWVFYLTTSTGRKVSALVVFKWTSCLIRPYVLVWSVRHTSKEPQTVLKQLSRWFFPIHLSPAKLKTILTFTVDAQWNWMDMSRNVNVGCLRSQYNQWD